MKKYWQALVALALITCLIVSAPTLAGSQPPDTSDRQIQGLPVMVEGYSLFEIPNTVQGISPEQRSQKIAKQVELFAKDTLMPIESLQVGERGKTMVIFYGSTIITEITEEDAKAANTTPRELSYIYLQKIQEFFKDYRQKTSLGSEPKSLSSDTWLNQTWKKISSLTIPNYQW